MNDPTINPHTMQGVSVTGTDGTTLGKVASVYLDNHTNRPEWVAIRTGLFGARVCLAPISQARLNGTVLSVPVGKNQLKSAPHHDPDMDLPREAEEDLYTHYGMSYSQRSRPVVGQSSCRPRNSTVRRSKSPKMTRTESGATARVRAYHRVAVIAVAIAGLFGPQAAGVAAAAGSAGPPCSDVEVVFARGTFETPGVGATGQAFVDALNARLGNETVQVYPVNYPASLDFQAAAEGVVDARNTIDAVATNCPRTKIVLGGYSQGAAVAAYTTADAVPDGYALPDGITGPMPPATATHVAAIALFGTPSPGILNLLDNSAPPITIGNLYSNRTIDMCASGDPICSPGGMNRSAHSAYKDNGMAEQAAEFTVTQLAAPR